MSNELTSVQKTLRNATLSDLTRSGSCYRGLIVTFRLYFGYKRAFGEGNVITLTKHVAMQILYNIVTSYLFIRESLKLKSIILSCIVKACFCLYNVYFSRILICIFTFSLSAKTAVKNCALHVKFRYY